VHRFVVLLRGVNVGKSNRVPMAEFKAMLHGLGYTDVVTLLNSGNAVISSADSSATQHAECIATALADSMGVTVPVVVKSRTELAEVVVACPFTIREADYSQFLAVFANDSALLQSLAPLQALVQPPDQFAIGSEAAYGYCAAGIKESKLGKALLGKAGKSVTTRNWATVLKLLSLCGERFA
jgi:uncharacterized protein (DUF1697 family)